MRNTVSLLFVLALAACGGSSPQNHPPPLTQTLPDAPTAVVATPTPGSAKVQWSAPANLGSGTLSHYLVVTQPGGATATASETQLEVTGLQNGTAYTFTVAAVTSVGQGPDSAPSQPVTPADKPGAPSAVSATPGIRSATLQWTAPADNGSAITGYRVEVSAAGGAFAPAQANVSGTSATVTGLLNGGSYSFRLAAQNAVGEGAMSEATAPITLLDVPALPAITVAQSATEGTVVTASVAAVDGVTYAWSVDGGTVQGAASGTTTGAVNEISWTAGAAGTATVHCVASDAAGSTEATATVQIISAPQAPVISAPAQVTEGVTATASVTGRAGMSYSWAISGGTLSATTGASVGFVASGPGTVSLQCVETNALGVSSSAGTLDVTADAAPATPTISVNPYVTAGATESASISPRSGMTYSWTISGGTLSSATGASVSFVPGASGTVTLGCVETNAAGAQSTAGSANTTIEPAPQTPTITAPAKVAAGATGQIASVSGRSGMSYSWSIAGPGTLAATTGTSVTFSSTGTGTITLSCVETNLANASSAPGSASVAATSPHVTLRAHPAQTSLSYGTDVTATAVDGQGYPLQGVSIQLTASPNGVTFNAASGTSDATGTFKSHATASAAGSFQVGATASFTGVSIPVSAIPVTFTSLPWVSANNVGTPSTSTLTLESVAIDPQNGNNLWVGDESGVIRSINGGSPWSSGTGVNDNGFWAVAVSHPFGGLSAWALSMNASGVWRSKDGSSWSLLGVSGVFGGLDLAVDPTDSSQQTVFAAFSSGQVEVTYDDGRSWSALPGGGATSPMRMTVDRNGNVFVGDASGEVYRLNKGYSTWGISGLRGIAGSVYAIAADPARGYLMVGFSSGQVWASTDGVSYRQVATFGGSVNDLAFGPDGSAWAVTNENGGVYRADGPWSGFKLTNGGLPASAFNAIRVDVAEPLNVYVVGPAGVFKTTTGGK